MWIKQILLTLLLFIVAMASGIVIGRSSNVAAAPERGRERSWLADQLELSPEQREKMREIWQETLRGDGQRQHERRREIQRERDEALQALLTPEQKEQQKKIVDEFNGKMAEINKEREAAFQNAVESTKAILDDSQRAKYEELMKRGPGPGGSGGPGGPDGRGGPWRRPGGGPPRDGETPPPPPPDITEDRR